MTTLDKRTVQKLSELIQVRSVSKADYTEDKKEFARLQRVLAKSFPQVHKRLKKETVGGYGLLYTWEGRDAKALPVLLMAHLDVVPAEDEGSWVHPPFSGKIDGSHVWGRGALDTKVSAFAILEAVERLCAKGGRPLKTVYIAFGMDEEVGGQRGAKAIAEKLRERKLRFEYVLDEGATMVEGMLSFVRAPIALIGIAEKGRLTAELIAEDEEGGHSSFPEKHTAIGLLSEAVRRIESHPFPCRMTYATRQFLSALAPHAPFPLRFLLRHTRLFKGILISALKKDKTTRALLHTTQAVTVIRGGTQENVLPSRADALINLRILPGETITTVLNRYRRIVKNTGIRISAWEKWQPSNPVKPCDIRKPSYAALCAAVAESIPEAVCVPYLVTASTDSRFFEGLTDSIYRFVPLRLSKEELGAIHGKNERVSFENMALAVRFYLSLLTS